MAWASGYSSDLTPSMGKRKRQKRGRKEGREEGRERLGSGLYKVHTLSDSCNRANTLNHGTKVPPRLCNEVM